MQNIQKLDSGEGNANRSSGNTATIEADEGTNSLIITADADEIYRVAQYLFRETWNRDPVRLLGVGVSSIQPATLESPDLFSAPGSEDRRRRLVETIDRIEDRFGRGKVIRAKMLGRKKAGDTGTPSMRDVE